MGGRKRIREEVKETIDDAVRLVDRGAGKAVELIDRGVRKIEEGARLEGRVMPPTPPARRPSIGEAFDETAMLIGRAGKKVSRAADRGIKRVGAAIESEPGLKRAVDRGVAAVDRVVEKSVEIAKKGLRKTDEIVDGRKKR